MMVYVSVENFHAWGILSTPDSLKIHGAPRVEIFEGSICRAGSEKNPANSASRKTCKWHNCNFTPVFHSSDFIDPENQVAQLSPQHPNSTPLSLPLQCLYRFSSRLFCVSSHPISRSVPFDSSVRFLFTKRENGKHFERGISSTRHSSRNPGITPKLQRVGASGSALFRMLDCISMRKLDLSCNKTDEF